MKGGNMKFKLKQKVYMPNRGLYQDRYGNTQTANFIILEIEITKIELTEKEIRYNERLQEDWLFLTPEEAKNDLLQDLQKDFEKNKKIINNLKPITD